MVWNLSNNESVGFADDIFPLPSLVIYWSHFTQGENKGPSRIMVLGENFVTEVLAEKNPADNILLATYLFRTLDSESYIAKKKDMHLRVTS